MKLVGTEFGVCLWKVSTYRCLLLEVLTVGSLYSVCYEHGTSEKKVCDPFGESEFSS